MVVDEGDLQVGVYPVTYTVAGVRLAFDGATGINIPDDGITRMFLDSAGNLQLAADYPIDASVHLPLATVTAAAGTLAIEDDRALTLFQVA